MTHRTAKFVCAIFASLLVGSPLVTVSHSAPAEADKCLSAPKGPLPAGGHWYYRIERGTKRQCWYIGDEKEKSARAAPATSPSAATPAPPPPSANKQSSIANARAELPLPQARVEREPGVFTGQRLPATIAATTTPGNDQRADADAAPQRSVIASRWPELAGVSTPASPEPSTDSSAANAPEPPAAEFITPRAAPPAAVAPLPRTAANISLTDDPSGSVQMLLIAILGALALAGLLVSVIFRFAGRRRRTNIRVGRRVNWDAVRTDHPSVPDEVQSVRPVRELDFPREPREARVPDERIEQMLARLARSNAT